VTLGVKGSQVRILSSRRPRGSLILGIPPGRRAFFVVRVDLVWLCLAGTVVLIGFGVVRRRPLASETLRPTTQREPEPVAR
jgi:hypothetical protein